MKLDVIDWDELPTLFALIVKGISLLLLLVFLVLGVFVFFHDKPLPTALVGNLKKRSFAYETIGTGPLALNPHLFFRSVPSLLEGIVFIMDAQTPGSTGDAFLIGIKSIKELRAVKAGERVFLSVDEADPSFPKVTFSSKITSFCLRPLLSEKNAVLCEATLGAEGAYSSMNLLIKEVAYKDFDPQRFELFEKQPYLKELKQARCFGKDALYQNYAGESLSSLKEAMKFEIPSEKILSYHLLKPLDILYYREGSWKKLTEEKKEGCPKACLTGYFKNTAKFTIWDETGLMRSEIDIPLTMDYGGEVAGNLDMQSLKLRSPQTISCLLGKRRLLIKKGDWLLKAPRGWRVLRTMQDIQDCLTHKQKGILFILDRIEMEKEKAFISGHYFDEMRTQIKPLELQVDLPKSPSKASSNKVKPRNYKNTKAARKA